MRYVGIYTVLRYHVSAVSLSQGQGFIFGDFVTFFENPRFHPHIPDTRMKLPSIVDD